jgi:hypothetical protein
MKTMLDIINALTSLGIVGFLIYFFIYYRKPMKSVLDAIGDTDSLKAGPLEYKRRKAINKVIKDINIVASKSDAAIISQPSKLQNNNIKGSIAASSNTTGSLSSKPKLVSVRIGQLEEENANLKKQLLGMSVLAASTAENGPNPKLAESMQKIIEQHYKEVLAIDPKSEIIKSASKLLKFTIGDRFRVKFVNPDDVNTPDEIPPEESQQSNP